MLNIASLLKHIDEIMNYSVKTQNGEITDPIKVAECFND
jgi:hypothetical protein